MVIAEVRNIGGVYKASLTPHVDVIRNFVSHEDTQFSELAKEIVDYYDGKASYMYDAFLLGQVCSSSAAIGDCQLAFDFTRVVRGAPGRYIRSCDQGR